MDNADAKRNNTVVSSLLDATGTLNSQRARVNRIVLTLVVLGGIAGLLAFSFSRSDSDGAPVAVIQPETTFTRIKPADSEGMEIPNQDKMVYSQINSAGGENAAQIERIAPAPEQPLNRLPDLTQDKAPVVTDTTLQAGGALKPLITPTPTQPLAFSPQAVQAANPVARPRENVEVLQPLPTIGDSQTIKTLGNVAASASAARPAPVATKTPAPANTKPSATTKANDAAAKPKVTAETKPLKTASVAPAKAAPAKATAKEAPKAAATPAAVTKGSFRIQLAAVRSQALASESWTKIRSSHSAALGKAQKFVEPVNASDKNTLYRLQAGSWTSRDDAAKVCNTLKAAGTSCLVVAK